MSKNPKILCIETSSTNCSVALASKNGAFENNYNIDHCLDLIEDNSDSYSHGERLHVFINQILQRNQLTVQDLSAVAVSEGPGSYTGLRIGVASAKGISYALDIPMIAVNTLASLCKQNILDTDFTIAMLDARRMEVYAAVYDKQDEIIESPQPVVLDEDSFLRFRESAITFIGTGIEKFEHLIADSRHHYHTTNPTALTMCDIAISKHEKSDIENAAYFEPLYLKEVKIG